MLLSFQPAAVLAHPISLTRASVYVARETVSARIEVFVEDLFLFHNLRPNHRGYLEPGLIRDGIDKHEQFLLERFRIRDVSGRLLTGRVVAAREPEMSADGIALAELMAHEIVFDLVYEVVPETEFLTFSQHFTEAETTIPAEMRLVVQQENAAASHDSQLKSGAPETIRFDWTSSPLTAEASSEERHAWLTRQKKETLGITSYSSVYSFLYIEDHEVRHEILIPLLTLDGSVGIARDGDDFLDLTEQDAARPEIEAYFAAGNPIEIDGVQVEPQVERCDFYGLDFKDFARRSERRSVSLASARVGIILTYAASAAPGTVKLTWDRFNENVWAIDTVVCAYDDTSKTTLARIGGRDTFEWRRADRRLPPPVVVTELAAPPAPTWSIPVISLACLVLLPFVTSMRWSRARGRGAAVMMAALLAGGAAATWPLARWDASGVFTTAPEIAARDADRIFGRLHRNIFRAFDHRRESDIYEVLSRSVDGDLLEDLYLQIRQRLEVREQGGAVSRVREVRILESTREPLAAARGRERRGFGYRCRWTARGTVEHWGHVHERTNEYEAMFAVEPRNGAWKITDMDVLDERRIGFETRLRGL